MATEGQLKRSSLGRIAFIGELYDARTESFSSRSLLQKNLPSGLIEQRDVQQMEFDYKFTENVSERFELMNVESELQVGILLDLISVDGSGRFLLEETKSDRTVSCTLVCKMSTTCEKLFASFGEILGHIDLSCLETLEHTHVVTEVYWGARCLLSLAATCKEESSKEELKGKLKAEVELLKKVLSVAGGGQLEKEKCGSGIGEDVKIKVCADIVPDGQWPTSFEGFRDFVVSVPKLLKKLNGGKGKPLNYVMIPLNTFRKLARLSSATEIVVRAIDESFLMSTVFFFDEVALLKRKLYDLMREMTMMRNYVKEEDLKEGRKRQGDLALKESELKLMISEDWVQVKSGTKGLNELVRRVEKFKSRELSLSLYEEYLESMSKTLKKLALVKEYLSIGVVYLGREDDFNVVLTQNLSWEFLVLLVSSEMKEEDPNLFFSTNHYFLTEACNPKPKTKYVVVDFDLRTERSFLGITATTARCLHLKGSKILSSDAYGDCVADLMTCFVRLKPGSEVEFLQHKPGNRVALEMICPGGCSENQQWWTCFRCKETVEYGFDQYFYCSCGKARVDDFEYRCSDSRHGEGFVPGKKQLIQKGLSLLRPLKELNVLIIGQSGVGKSTWINSIVNYLKFETLDLAREHGVICTIPTSFTMYDSKSLKKHVISIGEDENERTDIGHSATRCAQTYSFIWEGKIVRLIDTPGLGDTQGIDQDKKNLKNIINHLEYLKNLHAVCILLKANDNRITAIFSYCFKELLAHLHKSVSKNIVFCFTNARNSFYSPGQTSALLETLLKNLEVDNFSLGHHNMFCLDNEAFLFLCSLTNPQINHDQSLLDSFTQSWQISLKETQRLFRTINTFEPHLLKETTSLLTARNRILYLAKPIAEISRMIQINVATIERKREEIRASEKTVAELSKSLNITEVYLKSELLTHPRTVCTSPSCVEYLTFTSVDVKEIEYKTHCHDWCQLTNVEAATVKNPLLRECQAMGSEGKCRKCGCGWENHMHIRYAQKREERKVVDKLVESRILERKSEKDKMENLVRELEEKIEKFRKEQEFIIQASVKFGVFLRRNAITVYNDSVAEYMEYLIDVEESKPYKSETEKNVLQRMKDMLEFYQAESQIFLEVIRKGENKEEEISVEDVMALEQQLYKLEMTGECLKSSADCSRLSHQKMADYKEIPIRISRAQKKVRAVKPGTDILPNGNKEGWKKILSIFSDFF